VRRGRFAYDKTHLDVARGHAHLTLGAEDLQQNCHTVTGRQAAELRKEQRSENRALILAAIGIIDNLEAVSASQEIKMLFS
jgi:hypothetical protein